MLDDLRLNQDCSDFVTMGYLLERDQKVRHNVFWGCYVYDKCVVFTFQVPHL